MHLDVVAQRQDGDRGFSSTALSALMSLYVFLKASRHDVVQPLAPQLLGWQLVCDLGAGIYDNEWEQRVLVSRFGVTASKLYRVKLNADARPARQRPEPIPYRVRMLRTDRLLGGVLHRVDPIAAEQLALGTYSEVAADAPGEL